MPKVDRRGPRRARAAGGGSGCYALGLTQVSDQARQALDDCRSPRISGQTLPAATWPFT